MSTYAILPSNSLAETFPENTTSNFTIPLSEPLDFPKNEYWKIGLLEVQIPITFYNFEDSDDRNIIFSDEHNLYREKIPNGSYNSAIEIIKKINKIFLKFDLAKKGFKKIFYLENIHTVLISLSKGQQITFSSRLSRILGFPRKLDVAHGKTQQVFRSSTANPWKDFNHIFIYSDLVEDRLVNSSSRALLGSVSINQNQFGSLLVRSFLSPELLKPRYEHYSTINFQLCNELDQTVRFRAGSVVLKLKFTNARRNSGSTE